MTEHICRNCRWWNDSVSNHGYEYRECLRINESDSKAGIASGPASGVSLMTEPDFGCVQWEGKE